MSYSMREEGLQTTHGMKPRLRILLVFFFLSLSRALPVPWSLSSSSSSSSRFPTSHWHSIDSGPSHRRKTRRRGTVGQSIRLVTSQGRSSADSAITSNRSSRHDSINNNNNNNNNESSAEVPLPAVSYKDLSPLGRFVASTVEMAVTTAMDYLTGGMAGYFFGVITDIPSLLFRSSSSSSASTTASAALSSLARTPPPPPLPPHNPTALREVLYRFHRMHNKSIRSAHRWGSISAVFGGVGVAVRVIRGGTVDEWNAILTSVAVGAYMGRTEGFHGMIRSAVLYGGFAYLLAGPLFTQPQRRPFAYQEEAVEF